MKFLFTLLCLSFSILSFSQVRISQVYGAGGNTSATYNRDFVEIFNAGTGTVDISNWSVQYASATGPSTPGNWAVATIASGSIAPGKYFLVSLASGGAPGIALPAADATNNTINISNSAGKIALVNNSTALNGTTACSDASVVDVIGYGATATCFEASPASTTGTDNTMSLQRGSNGCTETNNNLNDFALAAVNPRNSSSAANTCGPPSAFLSAGPNITNMTSNAGVFSAEQSFTLSGANLTGFPSTILVTASAGLEISKVSGSGFAASATVAYTSATLAPTTIYVRIKSNAPQGAINGTVTSSGGGASADAVVTVTGGVYQNYYNTKANNGLNTTSTWSNVLNGSGTSPVDFTTAYQLFNIVNQANANLTNEWTVTGAGNSSRVIVGDGSAALNLVIPAGADSITSATRVDVLNNATLTLQNNNKPFLNFLANGSTVNFAQAGTSVDDTIHIPSISYYHLKLTNGLKYFSSNTTTVRGNLTADAVVNMNGSSPTFSTLNVFGNVSLLNGAQFQPLPSGDAARITLAMNGSGTQTITGGSLLLFRLQRDTTSSNSVIDLKANLTLGNNAGGGLRLNQGASTTTILHIPDIGRQINIIGAAAVSTSANGKISSVGGTNIDIAKTSGNANAGTLRFVSGSLINLAVNMGASLSRDSIMIADSVNVESLALNKGRVVVNPGAVLTVTDGVLLAGGSISGGSTQSFVDGKLRRSGFFTSPDFKYPLGKGDKYAPLDIETSTGDFTTEYFKTGYGNYTIDPTTLATYPNYNVSHVEYWTIDKNGFAINPNITFHYTDARSGVLNPSALKVAHNDLTDWDDLGGTAGPSNTTTSGYVTVNSVSVFSPFTFSARVAAVLPVKITSFAAQKAGTGVHLTWSTSQESNSSHFMVQQSTDGRTWKDISRINAAGSSTVTLDYNATDLSPAKGINFYRLKIFDRDNRFEYSETRTVLFSARFDIVVSPNPVKDRVNIYLSKEDGRDASIILTDNSGRVLEKRTVAGNYLQLNIAGLSTGTYFLTVKAGDRAETRQVVIQ